MIDYLSHEGFLRPAYGNPHGTRGKVRYYSYRDLVVARLIQRLRDTGVELRRLKSAVQQLNQHPHWVQLPDDPADQIRWLVSDGLTVFIKSEDGFLEDLGKGQRVFSFIVNLDQLANEVRKKVPAKKRKQWSIDNTSLEFEPVKVPAK